MRMLWKKATLLGLAGFALGVLTGIGFMLASLVIRDLL